MRPYSFNVFFELLKEWITHLLSQTNMNQKSISELQISARTIGRCCSDQESEIKAVIREYGPKAAAANSLSLSFDHKYLAGQQGENVSSALGILLTGMGLKVTET